MNSVTYTVGPIAVKTQGYIYTASVTRQPRYGASRLETHTSGLCWNGGFTVTMIYVAAAAACTWCGN